MRRKVKFRLMGQKERILKCGRCCSISVMVRDLIPPNAKLFWVPRSTRGWGGKAVRRYRINADKPCVKNNKRKKGVIKPTFWLEPEQAVSSTVDDSDGTLYRAGNLERFKGEFSIPISGWGKRQNSVLARGSEKIQQTSAGRSTQISALCVCKYGCNKEQCPSCKAGVKCRLSCHCPLYLLV